MIRAAFTLLIILSLLTACGQGKETTDGSSTSSAADTAMIRIAVLPTLDCIPLVLAKEHGWFKQQGIEVGLCVFQAQMDCDTAFERGRVQAMITDLVRTERLRGNGCELEYLTHTSASWQLLTNRAARIKQLKQLDDKMLAMTRFSATDLFGDMAVDSAKLKSERVFRIQINDVTVRLNMLETGIMDAMFLPEPQATAGRNMRAHKLLDTRSMNLQLGVLAVRQNSIPKQKLDLFMKAYSMACDSLNHYGLQAYGDLIKEWCNVDQATIDSLPQDYAYPNATMPQENDMKLVQQWLKKKQQLR